MHLAPEGTGSGTREAPAGTFAVALETAWTLNGGAGNIEVIVQPGTYRAEQTVFTHPLDGNRLRIQADGAVFEGGGAKGYWLDVAPSGGGGTVEVVGASISGYANGLRITGGYTYREPDRLATTTGDPVRAVVSGVGLTHVGSRHGAGGGYAAVHLQNVHDSLVTGSVFTDLGSGGGMHGVYVVAGEADVTDSVFTDISGDAVRYRHGASGTVADSTFTRTGSFAVSTWFCDVYCARSHAQSPECPSLGVRTVRLTISGTGHFADTVAASRADPRCP